MSGAILKFPGNQNKAAALCPPAEMPLLERFDPDSTLDLYKLAKSVYDRATDLIEFVDSNRLLAQEVGVETIAIEISAMLEGGNFVSILDSLRDSASKGKSTELSLEGLGRLRRAEKLISEATSNLNMHSGQRYSLGRTSPSSDPSIWMPFILIGAISIVGIVAAIAFTSIKKR